MRDYPPTPPSTLQTARRMALSEGIRYCYVGNVHDPEGQTTYCPNCKSTLIERDWHSVYQNRIEKGHCPDCGAEIAGKGMGGSGEME